MGTIQDAKRSLADRFRREEGFVGVGLFKRAEQEGLRVYVVDMGFPVARYFASNAEFEGYPVVVEVSGEAQAQSR